MRTSVDVRRLTQALPERDGWQPPVVLAEVGSTNVEARRRGVPWQPVLAEQQTAGRGRLGRRWGEVPRAGVAVSVLVPRVQPDGWLPLVTGLAVREAVAAAGVQADLKWPNDVLLPADEDRKTCGILCELVPGTDLVVVGAGVNVDHDRDELPVPGATSVRLAGGRVDRTGLAARLLIGLRRRHAAVRAGGTQAAAVREEYRAACVTIGREVDVHLPDGSVQRHHVAGVADDGGLRLRGRFDSLSAGDVHHIRPPGTDAASG